MGSLFPTVRMAGLPALLSSCLLLLTVTHTEALESNNTRSGRVFSLFSIVQFPNLRCTSSTSTSTYGTCMTSSECTSNGGTSDGNCAAGIGVCCIISTSTCSTTVSTNTTYIRNPGYPSTYTPSNTGTCIFTVSKVSADVCQLRLDFQTMSGYVTMSPGACTDSFTAKGQTGTTLPSICGTNTDYHMYVEFGATSTDTVSLTHTLGSTTSTLKWNILAQQIPCTATYRAPIDCLQYFTGKTNTVYSYNFAGSQFLNGMDYTNCIRTEKGFCGIQWMEKSATTPDAFHVFATASTAAVVACPTMSIYIPTPTFGPVPLISRAQPFILGVHSTASPTPNVDTTNTGFALEYNQVGCL